MITILLSCIITLIEAYKILPYDFDESVIKYSFCDEIDNNLINTTIEVIDHYNNMNFNTLLLTNDTGKDVIPICNEFMTRDRYGYAKFINTDSELERSIHISYGWFRSFN